MRVILIKEVGYCGDNAYYARWFDMPIPPQIGLGIVFDKHLDPEEIIDLFINLDGDAVCEIERDLYGARDIPANQWPKQLNYHVGSWHRLDKDQYCFETSDLEKAIQQGLTSRGCGTQNGA